MPNHFLTIGLPVDDPDGLKELALLSARAGRATSVPHGYYIQFSPGGGAELWAQATPDRNVMGCHPHFAGSARLAARVDRVLPRPRSALDGSLLLTAVAEGAEFPLCADVPDFDARATRLEPGAQVTMQVAAFASELHCFEDEKAFRSSRHAASGLATRAFIPSGLFGPGNAPAPSPSAHAIFSGEIIEAETRVNALTGIGFQYLLVHSLGGTYDVVADPSIVQGKPRLGGVVFGSFWLSARLV